MNVEARLYTTRTQKGREGVPMKEQQSDYVRI